MSLFAQSQINSLGEHESRGETPIDASLSNLQLEDVNDEVNFTATEAWKSYKKHVFVLSSAGKPIYCRYKYLKI